jgi:AcrR family transcriptional regulator
MPNRASKLIWEAQEPADAKQPLTRARIVDAALEVADAEGLQAVSIRRVAARLGVQPMSLYSHIPSKDDLVALMLDEVSGQLLIPEPVPAQWREALRQSARRAFAAYVAHPWALGAMGQGARAGPNLLRRAEQVAGIATRVGLELPDCWMIASIVHEWVIGHALHVLKLREDPQLAQHLHEPDPAPFSALASLLKERGEAPQGDFERALEVVLDGIETRVDRAAGSPASR